MANLQYQLSWWNQIIYVSSQFGSDYGKTTEIDFNYGDTMTNDYGETMTIDSRETMTSDYMERLELQVDYD